MIGRLLRPGQLPESVRVRTFGQVDLASRDIIPSEMGTGIPQDLDTVAMTASSGVIQPVTRLVNNAESIWFAINSP